MLSARSPHHHHHHHDHHHTHAHHHCHHLPVTELNPIEQFWAAAKEYLRQVCGYTGPELVKNVPEAIRAIPLQQVQRCFRHAERFENLHRWEHQHGLLLTGPVRDYAMKKHERHRTVPANLLHDLGADVLERKHELEVRLKQKEGRGSAAAAQAKLARITAVLGMVDGASGNQTDDPGV